MCIFFKYKVTTTTLFGLHSCKISKPKFLSTCECSNFEFRVFVARQHTDARITDARY